MKQNNTIDNATKQSIIYKIATLNWLRKYVIVEIIAHLFIILFLYTGVSKLIDFLVFQEQLAESPVLEPFAPIVAWALPFTEFLVSALLFFPRYRLKGFYATLILMVLFTSYVVILLSFSTELPCSCGGILQVLSWPAHLVLNIGLTGFSIIGIIQLKKIKRAEDSL